MGVFALMIFTAAIDQPGRGRLGLASVSQSSNPVKKSEFTVWPDLISTGMSWVVFSSSKSTSRPARSRQKYSWRADRG